MFNVSETNVHTVDGATMVIFWVSSAKIPFFRCEETFAEQQKNIQYGTVQYCFVKKRPFDCFGGVPKTNME